MAKTQLLYLPLQAQAELELRRRSQEGKSEYVAPGQIDFAKYRSDPVGFGMEVFKEEFAPDVISVMESVRDYPVTVARSSNGVGKTHGAARVALWFYKCFPDSQVYTTAAPPEGNLRRLLWGEIGSLVQKHQNLFRNDRVISMNIGDGPQHFVTGVSIPMSGTSEQRMAKFSGKHAPNLLFIIDEGDAVPIEVYKAIESCMSGGNARLLVMFNPRAPAGPVYQMERDKQAHVVELSAFRHPNVLTGQDVIPGAVSRDKTVRRINEWSRPLIDGEIVDVETFEVPEFLVGCTALASDGHEYPPLPGGYRKITNPAFYYIVLGIYPPQAENQLISRSWLDAAVSRWLSFVAVYGENPPAMRPVLGFDVAEYGQDRNFACLRYGGFVPRPRNTWSGVDPDASAIRAARYYHDMNCYKAFVDATGVGAGVAPRMSRLDCDAYGIKVASSPTYETELGIFGNMRDQLWWTMREWLRVDPGAMLPPDDGLLEELATPSYAIINGVIKVTSKDVMRELLGRSPDLADGLGLTFCPDEMMQAEYGHTEFDDYRG